MAIIIRSADIYEKNNHNILLNNAIKAVTVQEKVIEIGMEGEQIAKQHNANSVFETAIVRYPEDYGRLRAEIFYTTGSVVVPKSEISINFSKNDISWTISGKCVGKDSFAQIKREQMDNIYTDNTDVSILNNFDQFDSGVEQKDFTQAGLWGENGKIIISKGKAKIEYTDESSITSIEKDANGDWIITFKILTKLSVLEAYFPSVFDRAYSYRGQLFNGELITLNIRTTSVNIKDTDTQVVVGDLSSGSPLSIESNQLVQPETTINGERVAVYNANEILSDWGNGKESVTLDVMVGEFYEADGTKAISTQDAYEWVNALPMTFEVGDIVTPYINVSKEIIEGENKYLLIEEVPLSEYENGVAKNFVVYDVEQINDGVAFQRLKLIESAGRSVNFVVNSPDIAFNIIREASPLAGAKTGTISQNSAIYFKDRITVTASGDIREWSIIVNGFYIGRGSQVDTINFTFEVDGDVEINAAQKEWRWVEYVSPNSSWGIQNTQTGQFTNDMYWGNFTPDKFNVAGFKVCNDFTSTTSPNRKRYSLRSMIWVNASTGQENSVDLTYLGEKYSEDYSEGDVQAKDGQNLAFWQYNESKYTIVFGNDVAGNSYGNFITLNCEKDGYITFKFRWAYTTGTAGQTDNSSYFNGYIKGLQFSVMQYEYS